MNKKIGVFICHCGGNISDYVDVEEVRQKVAQEQGVVLARTNMFVCSDAAQEEIAEAIKDEGLEALVIASCSPKLHQETFRRLAQRAGLNPYTYVQVNIREQCSWAHTHQRQEATEKAVRLVRAGVAKARLAKPLSPIEVRTVPAVLVLGAGVTGMRTALALADLGLEVHLLERESEVGGMLKGLYRLAPYGAKAETLIEELSQRVQKHPRIKLYLEAEIQEKQGSVGQFQVSLRHKEGEESLEVGAIIVATGAKAYHPKEGEYAYGRPGVVTLAELHKLLRQGEGLSLNGREINKVAFIYCVGSREKEGHTYCSRYCCAAAVHTGLVLKERFPQIEQFHLYRDMRTYGDQEVLYHQALEKGILFFRFAPPHVPQILEGQDSFLIRVKDELTAGEEVEIPCDLVVLVTGLEGSGTEELLDVLKLPVGKDGFFNEVHPKLRPVETVIDGLFIAGTCQGPKNLAESVASGLAAATKAGVLLLPGVLSLEPQVACVDVERCTWCGLCKEACPYEAISVTEKDGRQVAQVNPALCKGEGACVATCPEEAIFVQGYHHETIKAQIEALCKEEA